MNTGRGPKTSEGLWNCKEPNIDRGRLETETVVHRKKVDTDTETHRREENSYGQYDLNPRWN